MKKLNILFILGLLLLAISLMSNSGGRAAVQNNGSTGAPGENTCGQAGCHASGAFNPVAQIKVEDMDGNQVTEYFPGSTYKVTLTNQANGASGYGFQITSLDPNDNRIGEWSNQSANAQISALTNRTYLEQNSTSSTNVISADWTVGATESGDVTFYAATNAVNGNGGTSGDGTASTSITIAQAVTSSKELDLKSITLFPNPSHDIIYISSDMSIEQYEIYSVLGTRVVSDVVHNNQMDISLLKMGTYLVRLSSSNGETITKKIIKN